MARQKTIGQPYTIEREKRPSQKKELNKFQLSFLKAIERLEDPPKPTKWIKPIKESFKPIEEQKDLSVARLSLFLNPTLRAHINTSLSKKEGKYTDIIQLLKSKDEKDYVSGLDEIRTGVESGGHNVGASLGSLLFAGTDLVANTDFLEKFEKLMKKTRPEQPETWRGELLSLLTSFGIPGSLVTKVMARAGKVEKISKVVNKFNNHKASKIAMRVGNWATVGGATDFLVNYEGRPTVFVKPEDTSQLKGKKKAAAEFRNRVKFGFEGSVLGGLMPLTGKGLQLGYKYGLRPVGEPVIGFGAKTVNNLTFRPISYVLSKDKTVLPAVAKGLLNTGKFTTMKMLAPLYASRGQFGKGYFQLPPFEQWRLGDVNRRGLTQQRLKKLDNFLSWFRAYGKAPKDIENVTEVVSLFIKSKARKINRIYEGLEKNAYKLAKEFEKRHNTNKTSPVGEKYFLDEVEMFLRGQRKLTDLPKKIQGLSLDLEKNIKSIMGELRKALPKGKDADEVVKALSNVLTKDVKNYMVKSFKTFTNPNHTPPKELVENAADWLAKNVIRNNKDHRKAALEMYGDRGSANAIMKEYGRDLVNKILVDGRGEGRNPLSMLKYIGQNILRDKKYKFLKTGEELPDAIRKLLGEEINLKASIMFTTTDAVAALAQKRAADFIAKSGLKNGWLFRDEALAITKYPGAQQITKLPLLGNQMKTELTGLWTSPEYVQMLMGSGGGFHSKVLANFYKNWILRPKAMVQAGKTLYSPQTQVRNVTAGTLFATLAGHIGHNASLGDSIRIVLRDIYRSGRGIDETAFNNHVEKLIKHGVWDENVVASELRAVFNDIKAGTIKTEEEMIESLLKKTSITEKTARTYAGGDNLWKSFGFEFDKSMLSQGLKSVDDVEKWFQHMGANFSRNDLITQVPKSLDEALDEAAAYLIRNSYPTYSKVPPVIQNLRKWPIGNFVSFPSEIIRTVPTNLSMGLKMATHSDAVIRQMGYRRLMGTALATYGIGKGVAETAYYLTGTTEAQMNAWKRSIGAPWDRNRNIIPITSFKNGEASAVNFSYFTPYDLFDTVIESALNKAYKQNLNPQEVNSYVLQQVFATDGPVWELLSPFMSEPIGFERFYDISIRGGKTAEGFTIYTDSDLEQDLGAVIEKSLMHIIDGVKPGFISTAQKIKMGIEGDLTKSGKKVDLKDELIALFTGTRIIRIDAKKDLQFIASNLSRILRGVDETEKFYDVKHWKTHTKNDMIEQFDQMQNEAFRIQKEVYIKLKDLQMLDLSRSKIEDLLEEHGLNADMAFNIVRGRYTPISYSQPRFEKKIKYIKEWLKDRAEKTGDTYSLATSQVFPERDFDLIETKWDEKKFFNETWDDESEQYIGGYYPERVEYLTDKKGNLVLDEDKNPIADPNFSQRMLQKIVPKIKEGFKKFINPLGNVMGKAPTPPLPQTPMPDQKLVASMPQINQQTGLTRTESALLSPSEQVIARRT
jgi:hypothetical protein